MMLALAGWAMALSGFGLALVALRERALRLEAVERASHELRGPLTAARLGLALGQRTGRLTRERIRAIDLELGRAALALDDLDGTTVVNAPVFCEPIDACDLLADSVEAWRGAAQAAGAEIEFSWRGGPAGVVGDRLRIAQATGNLIANAIEHGGNVIQVSGRQREDALRIEVVDNGPGLPAPLSELMRRSAHRRGRVRRRRSGPARQPGRGRGLAIASAIAEAHGGRIWSAPSQLGARVLMELPRAAAQEERAEPSS